MKNGPARATNYTPSQTQQQGQAHYTGADPQSKAEVLK
jgi:hypothetical protein